MTITNIGDYYYAKKKETEDYNAWVKKKSTKSARSYMPNY